MAKQKKRPTKSRTVRKKRTTAKRRTTAKWQTTAKRRSSAKRRASTKRRTTAARPPAHKRRSRPAVRQKEQRVDEAQHELLEAEKPAAEEAQEDNAAPKEPQ